jgi:hypothetical protein
VIQTLHGRHDLTDTVLFVFRIGVFHQIHIPWFFSLKKANQQNKQQNQQQQQQQQHEILHYYSRSSVFTRQHHHVGSGRLGGTT